MGQSFSLGVRTWRALALAGAVTLGVAAACGGDPQQPSQPVAAGGTAGTGAGGSDAGPPDTVAPTFTGITALSGLDSSRARVSWSAARDDRSKASVIAYRIYVGAAEVDFSKPWAVAPAGATTLVIGGLHAGVKYAVAVRAVDGAGNEDKNVATKSVTLADGAAPIFGGVSSLQVASPTSLDVSWLPAHDDVNEPAQLKYRIYLTTTEGELGAMALETAAGATSATLVGLLTATRYFVVVRAVDAAGKEDANRRVLSAATPDVTPPIFAGLTGAVVGGTAVRLTWAPAADEVDQPALLRYRVYRAEGTAAFDFTAPLATSDSGRTELVVLDNNAATNYRFLVRAVDLSGNENANTTELSVTTAVKTDVDAPVFSGLTTASATGSTFIDLSWTAATDGADGTAVEQLVYDVYLATKAGSQRFDLPPTVTSVPGATAVRVPGLVPATQYFFVVRARDIAGNEDENLVERSATTKTDDIPPTFAGVTSVTASSPTSLLVGWSAATDETTPASEISYAVYVAKQSGGQNFAVRDAITSPGVTSISVNGLAPDTDYFVVVRAIDGAGNETSNAQEIAVKTPKDVTAPTFVSAPTITPVNATTIDVSWSAASDNVTPAGQLDYSVFIATTSGAQTNVASASTSNGVTTATITGLLPNTPYFVVVKASDAASNLGTSPEGTGSTKPDTTPPTFAGVKALDQVTFTGLRAVWDAATDDATSASAMRYRVCWSVTPGACVSSFVSMAEVTGSTSFSIGSLYPGLSYNVVVRAVDEAGLQTGGTVELAVATTEDTTGPTFGAATVSALSATSLRLSWAAATDDVFPTNTLIYDVWQASSSGGQNLAAAPSYSTAAGATQLDVTGLTPDTSYFFVVRARDPVGNRSPSPSEASGKTQKDTTAPVFTNGPPVIGTPTVTTIPVSWPAATDNSTLSAAIKYELCVTATSGGCSGASFTPALSTAAGATGATLTGLNPGQAYFVVVSAVDAYGNGGQSAELSTSTVADTLAPTNVGGSVYTGVTSVDVINDKTLTVNFAAAIDNATPAAQIEFLVCMSTTATGCVAGFTTTRSLFNTTSTTFTNLNAGQTYYFAVRARDLKGNTTTNTSEFSATTANDSTAPTGTAAMSSATPQTDGSSVQLVWTAGTVADPGGTAVAQMRYRVYLRTAAGSFPAKGSPNFQTGPGATSFLVTGLTPLTNYFFTVAPLDQSNNEGDQATAISTTTLADGGLPTFAGATGVSSLAASSFTVNWAAGSDNVTPVGSLVYEVCVATNATQCTTSFTATVTSAAGATSVAVPNRTPNTPYWILAKAKDAKGNLSNNTTQITTTTPQDTTAPTFGGITSLTAGSPPETVLNVGWNAATDDVTAPAAIVYEVCWGVAGDCGGGATQKLVTGVTSTTITGLSPGTSYTVRVRARDTATVVNTSSNSNTITRVTDTDDAPTWSASAAAVLAPTGGMVLAESFYDNTSLVAPFDTSRVGTNLNYPTTGWPGTLVTTSYSARFSGWLVPPKTGSFTFTRTMDAAGTGQLVVNGANVGGSGANTVTGTASLSAGVPVPFSLSHSYTSGGSRTVQLAWTPPAGVSATIGTASSGAIPPVDVTWSALASDDLTAQSSLVYDLCWNTAGNCTVAQQSVVNALTSTINDGALVRGSTYTVRVFPRDATGNRGTPISATFVVPVDQGAPVGTSASFLNSASAASSQLTLNWTRAVDDVTAATSIAYDICQSTSSTACTTGFAANFTATNTTSRVMSGLGAYTPYYWVVRARDGAGNRDANTVVISDNVPPSVPGTPTLSQLSGGILRATWAGSSDALWGSGVRYDVWYRLSSGGWSNSFTTSTSIDIPTGGRKGTWEVTVRAQDNSGNLSAYTTSSFRAMLASYSAIIAPIFASTCAGCHTSYTPDGATNWSYGNTVNVSRKNVPATKLIVPNNTGASYMYTRVTSVSSPMPPGGVDSDVSSKMAEWINDGAPNN